jgi:agmatine deiminase
MRKHLQAASLTSKKLIRTSSGYWNSRVETKILAAKIKAKLVTVGLIQTFVSKDLSENMVKTHFKIEEAAAKGAQIVCLQELYRSRYFPQEENVAVETLAETIPGETTKAFSALARKHKITIIAPIFEKNPNGNFYNSAVVVGENGEILGTYRKSHIPYDPYFYEKDYFAAAEPNYQVFKTPHANISVLICYDQWFPEAARICCLQGAEIIFYPTAIGHIKDHTSTDGDWHDAWRTVQRAHAIANGIHIAAVNRVGAEGELEFWGGSFVCDSFGEVFAEASTSKEEVLVVTVDLAKNKKIQEGWGFLRNRRPDTYQALVEKRQQL